MGPLATDVLEQRREGASSDRSALYNRRRRILTSDLGYQSPNTAIVLLSRDGDLKPDFIETVLHQLDPRVMEIRQSKSKEDRNLSSCATVICSNPVKAQQVMKELRLMSTSVIAVSLLAFFRALVEAEIRYPCFGGGYTRIIIEGKKTLSINQKFLLEKELNFLGTCERINFHTLSGDYGTICTVIYRFAAHAIFAKTVLNDKLYHGTGRIFIQLKMTQKVKDIMGFVKEYFV